MLRKVTGCRWRRDFLNIVLTNGGSILLKVVNEEPNRELSNEDIELIKKMYPKANK